MINNKINNNYISNVTKKIGRNYKKYLYKDNTIKKEVFRNYVNDSF